MNKNSKIFIAGSNGMVGSAIKKRLEEKGYLNILTPSRKEADLTRQECVNRIFMHQAVRAGDEGIDVVIDCAAKVGGIHANNEYRAQFIYENLQIQNNLIHHSHLYGVKKLLFLGSSCIYPKFASQPIKEEYLLASPLEHTNEPYSVAKIAGIKMCESYYRQYGDNFISVMPTNQYGPNDNFHPENSHVLPGMLQRFHFAKEKGDKNVEVWGTGKARREFMHVDDLADACVFILENVEAKDIYEKNISHLNIGTGEDVSIAGLAELIAQTVDYKGKVSFDLDKPDGTLKKLLDVSRLHDFGWKHKISLQLGLKNTYNWYRQQKKVRLL